MNSGALRNFLVVVGTLTVAGFVGFHLTKLAGTDTLRTVMADLWPIQGLIAGAILTLYYRLHSDTTAVAALTAAQRRLLDSMVGKKSARLWALFILVAMPVFLVRISGKIPENDLLKLVLACVIAIALWSALLCLIYLPKMFRELRDFVIKLLVEGEEQERRQAALQRLSAAQQKQGLDEKNE